LPEEVWILQQSAFEDRDDQPRLWALRRVAGLGGILMPHSFD